MKEMTPKMEAPVNAKHKDTVFRMLYSNKETLLELYNALNGTDYRTVEDLEITTLENAVYLSMKNDVSFLLDAKMMLYEHQSTWNPNMPLRDLFYIARLMEKYVIKDSLYSSTLTKIPAPHFIVFYNGIRSAPEDTTLKLSDAFWQKEKDPSLELKVRFLNINPGFNSKLMERCKTLREYSQFVAKVRKYTGEEKAIEKAVEQAVTECIAEGILSDFLLSQRTEVVAMSIFEYNEAEEMRKFGQAEFRGGKAEGMAEILLLVLENCGKVPDWLKTRILTETEPSVFENRANALTGISSVEEFLERTGLKECP